MKRPELKQRSSEYIRERIDKLRMHKRSNEDISQVCMEDHHNLMAQMYQGLIDHLEHELEDRKENDCATR